MKLLFKFTILLFLIFALNSCSKANKEDNQETQPVQTTKNRLVGCWKHQKKTIIKLNEDGTLITNSTHGNGTWRLIGDDRLNFIYSDGTSHTHTIVALEDDLMIIKFNGILEFTWPRVQCE